MTRQRQSDRTTTSHGTTYSQLDANNRSFIPRLPSISELILILLSLFISYRTSYLSTLRTSHFHSISLVLFILSFLYVNYVLPLTKHLSLDASNWRAVAKREVQVMSASLVYWYASGVWIQWSTMGFFKAFLAQTAILIGLFNFISLL